MTQTLRIAMAQFDFPGKTLFFIPDPAAIIASESADALTHELRLLGGYMTRLKEASSSLAWARSSLNTVSETFSNLPPG